MNPSRVTCGADLPDSGGALPSRIIPCCAGGQSAPLHSLKICVRSGSAAVFIMMNALKSHHRPY